MSDLAERIREARRQSVEVSGFTFNFNRPTHAQAIDLYQEHGDTVNHYALCSEFVTGWEGVKESDCIPGGADTPVEWTQELWHEWICDRPDLWPELGLAIANSFLSHEQGLNQAGKA